eukprot:Gregarina_sp_Pseudo_9__2429@NODE_271_length_3339_cov_29_228182_g254_i0_p2_GENE_NODE_271_length_3339_cov_29_228182_g254_i0NODE_271_length_3339_cov_29_228182_g254_i0_p2_ORF_typecomplete_len289_score39_79Abhydrolase_2/PF02230_16/4_6e62Hydrolase_4/PF12146_8/13Hydrolase_4/PF12146_8/1_7e09Peptidase_S9/PF00326_21/1e09FSH1/PF03959_13/9_6e10DLH/PF01738_18/2_4e07Esterase_phd/PF10503_9/7e06LIP/PF03583_14/2_1e02LIP/PF03583_14/7_9e05Abhydrolase_6/PF12697_7/2_2e05Abhydrolase_6/PF12697_7/1_9e03Abhydrolase_3/PF
MNINELRSYVLRSVLILNVIVSFHCELGQETGGDIVVAAAARVFLDADMSSGRVAFDRGDSHGGEGLHRVPESGIYDQLIIFMHGLGDTAEGWAGTFVEFLTKDTTLRQRAKVILPTAPIRRISLNGGMPMPGWSDLYSLDMDGREDPKGFHESRERISNIIKKEMEKASLSPSNILIGGFSQGGATSYLTALTSEVELGGVIICSGWIPLRAETLKAPSPFAKKIPILHCHGTGDDVVNFKYGSASANLLLNEGYQVTFKTYANMGHWVVPPELNDILEFIRERLHK